MGKERFASATLAARRATPMSVSESRRGHAPTRRRAGGRPKASLAPKEVEHVGAGFIRPQQGKAERQSDNQDEEHRMGGALPGCSGRVAMIPVQFLSPEPHGCVGNGAAGSMQPRGLVPYKQ